MQVPLDLVTDHSRVAVAAVVALVALGVQVYSTWYLQTDDRYPRFAATVSLFTAAMLLVVVSGDLVLTVVGWEVMGWCSFLLIGHWSRRHSARRAAHKAFLVTRVADIGFVLGIIGLAAGARSTNLGTVIAAWARPTACIDSLVANGSTVGDALTACAAPDATLRAVFLTLVVIGVLGKSAQVPFQDWLADAMEGPTPASALIHAATMVAAGTVVLAGFFPLLVRQPDPALGARHRGVGDDAAGRRARLRPERPQAAARLVDGQPGRRHAVGARRRAAGRRAGCRSVPPLVARHLQGAALPRRSAGLAIGRRRHRGEGPARQCPGRPAAAGVLPLRPAVPGRRAAGRGWAVQGARRRRVVGGRRRVAGPASSCSSR